jgi:hypothetical protein
MRIRVAVLVLLAGSLFAIPAGAAAAVASDQAIARAPHFEVR